MYLRSFVLKFYETKSHFQNVQTGGFRDEISQSLQVPLKEFRKEIISTLIDRWDRYICGSVLTVGDSAITGGC